MVLLESAANRQDRQTHSRSHQFSCPDPHDEAGRLLLCYNDEAMPDSTRKDIQSLLFDEFRGTDACEVVASEIVDGREPDQQVKAAKALGERGLPTLANIARNSSVKTEIRREAVLGLCTYPDWVQHCLSLPMCCETDPWKPYGSRPL